MDLTSLTRRKEKEENGEKKKHDKGIERLRDDEAKRKLRLKEEEASWQEQDS